MHTMLMVRPQVALQLPLQQACVCNQMLDCDQVLVKVVSNDCVHSCVVVLGC
jgi:hypothetical protein